MQVQCSCGKFQARLDAFPKNTPGRMMCYCDDCQAYMLHLGRQDLLDRSGGTEIVPLFPSDVTILQGIGQLVCTQLAPGNVHRFSTKCCNSPVGNTRIGTSWLGLQRNMFTTKDPHYLEKTLGDVKARIMGKFAKGPVPPGTPDKVDLSATLAILPFMLKGKIFGKGKRSHFYDADNTPIGERKVLTKEERADLMKRWEAFKP